MEQRKLPGNVKRNYVGSTSFPLCRCVLIPVCVTNHLSLSEEEDEKSGRWLDRELLPYVPSVVTTVLR